MGHRYKVLFVCSIFPALSLDALDNSHFYRARLWKGEPRTAKSFLSSFDVSWVGASAHRSWDKQGKKVPLLTIFDPALFAIPHNGEIKQVSHPIFLSGQFDLTEVQIDSYVNVEDGFFLHVNLPVRHLTVSDIEPHFVTSQRELSNRAEMSSLRKNFISHLKRTGAGDLAVLAGWARTTYNTECMDFADLALQAGILAPTARRCTIDPACNVLPLGQGGSFGVPLVASGAVGFLNWLTFGAHIEGLFLFSRTDLMQVFKGSGEHVIRDVRVEPGTVWDLSVYAKADHFMRGFSALIGYSHNRQQPAQFKGLARALIPRSPTTQGWSMDIVHVVLEYDWADEDNEYGPRIGFNYNYVLRGKRVFNASTGGMYFGIDFVWNF